MMNSESGDAVADAAPPPVASSRGRRAGKPDTAAQILAVARPRFLREGYPSVTLRSIAAEAGCDVALISYHFGSKRGLFGAALELTVNPAEILQELLKGDLRTFAPRALRAFVTTWDSLEGGDRLRTLMRGVVADPALADLVRGGMQTEMIDKIAARLGGADARTRAGMFNSQMTGVMFSRYLLRAEPIASMTVDEIIRALAPSLTMTLHGLPRRPGSTHAPRAPARTRAYALR